MSHNKVTLVRAGGHIIAIPECKRVLSSYEFRIVPGKLIKGTHLGTPMIDLAMLSFGKQSTNKEGILTSSGFAYLVDEVLGEFEVISETLLPDFVKNLDGNISSAIVTTKSGKYPLIDIDAIINTNRKQIDDDLSSRRLI